MLKFKNLRTALNISLNISISLAATCLICIFLFYFNAGTSGMPIKHSYDLSTINSYISLVVPGVSLLIFYAGLYFTKNTRPFCAGQA